jgi:hypothetical protein
VAQFVNSFAEYALEPNPETKKRTSARCGLRCRTEWSAHSRPIDPKKALPGDIRLSVPQLVDLALRRTVEGHGDGRPAVRRRHRLQLFGCLGVIRDHLAGKGLFLGACDWCRQSAANCGVSIFSLRQFKRTGPSTATPEGGAQ